MRLCSCSTQIDALLFTRSFRKGLFLTGDRGNTRSNRTAEATR